MEIRLLRPDEIELRVGMINGKGCSLLLYKDARVDMKILDEVFGVTGWKRKHEIINGNLFCTVEIWDKEKGQWIAKEDVGVESYTEKEKGQASDAFKRACVNIGIGRELYTSGFVWVSLAEDESYKNQKGKFALNPRVKFRVKEIGYNDQREIEKLIIVDNKGKIRYKKGEYVENVVESKATESQIREYTRLTAALKKLNSFDNEKFTNYLKQEKQVNNVAELTQEQMGSELERFRETLDKLKQANN